MSQTVDQDSRFSDVEIPQFEGYKPLSVLAIIAFVVALLSPMAAIGLLFWILPAVSLVLSIVTMRSLSRPEATASGKGLAVTGFLLTILVVGYVGGRNHSRQQAIYDKARAHCQSWLQMLVDRKLITAHQLTFRVYERETGDLQRAYSMGEGEAMDAQQQAMQIALGNADDAARKGDRPAAPPIGVEGRRDLLDQFVKRPGIKRILDLGPDARIEFVANIWQLDEGRQTIHQRFAASNAQTEPFEFVVFAERDPHGHHADWRVDIKE